MLCPNIPPLPEEDRFIGCDGKVLSSELLMAQLKSAIDREDFEDAAIIRDELNRRVKEIFESIYEGQELKTVASKQTTLNKVIEWWANPSNF